MQEKTSFIYSTKSAGMDPNLVIFENFCGIRCKINLFIAKRGIT